MCSAGDRRMNRRTCSPIRRPTGTTAGYPAAWVSNSASSATSLLRARNCWATSHANTPPNDHPANRYGPAELEIVVVDADPIHAQHVLPDPRQALLALVAGSRVS